jgi:hypothetical protein
LEWKQKGVEAFLNWQHENPAGGGPDGWIKYLGLGNWEKGMLSKEVHEGAMKKMGIQM